MGKIETFEGIYSKLARSSDLPRILCGDFNSPKEELSNGDIVPWRPGNSRWSNGELSVISGLSKFNLPDVYRQLHGYPPRDFSWYPRPHIGEGLIISLLQMNFLLMNVHISMNGERIN